MLDRIPSEEQLSNFCFRLVDGDLDHHDRLYNQIAFSEVWRLYAQQIILIRNAHRP